MSFVYEYDPVTGTYDTPRPCEIDDMAIHPQPKPRPRILDRVAAKREHEKKALAFRLAVWRRDGARCCVCGKAVKRTTDNPTLRGEVHHRLTRGAHPDKRYDPENGVLLCAVHHGQVQRHEIDTP